MANIKISALPSVQPSGYTNQDLLVIVNYDVSSGTTKNTPLSGLTSYVLSGLTFPTDYLPLSGGTVTGDTIFSSGLTATTISAATYLGLPLDVYVTGGTYSAGTITFTNNSGGTFPVSGITSNAGNQWLIPTGDTVTVNSNYQYFIYGDIIVQGTLILETNSQLVVVNGDVINSGGTITNNGTISDIEIPLFDTQVTGGTYSAGTITFTNNSGGTFTVTGITSTFTGNTSGDCITDLFVSNVNSCSPLHIQNISSGDVLIGENGGVNVGIGTSTPTSKLHINNTTSGNTLLIEDNTNPDSTPFVIDNNGSVGIGTLTPNATLDIKSPNDFISSYGIRWFNSGSTRGLNIDNDGSLYLNGRQTINWANNNSFTALDIIAQTAQILNVQGFGSGTVCIGPGVADSNTKLHIKGVDSSSSNYGLKVQNSGGTDNLVVRNDGNVGIGTSNPTQKLHILSYGTGGVLAQLNDSMFDVDLSGGGGQLRFSYGSKIEFMINPYPSAFNTSFRFKSNPTGTSGENGIEHSVIGEITANGGLVIGESLNIGSTSAYTGTYHSGTIYGKRIQKNNFNNPNATFYPLIVLDGNVGIGTSTPSETLEVNGKTKTTNFQMTSGATTTGYVLTDSDGNGNAQWQPASGITGVGNVFKYTTTTAFTASVTQTITHNLNTKFIHCSVWDSSTDQLVTTQVVRTSGNQTNSVDITISTSGTYDILITG